MTRILLIFVVILAMSILLPACGDDDDDDGGHHSSAVDDDDIIDDDDSVDDDDSTDDDDNGGEPLMTFALIAPDDRSETLSLAIDDVALLLGNALEIDVPVYSALDESDALWNIAVQSEAVNGSVFSETSADLTAEAFMLRRATVSDKPVFAILAADDRGAEFGLYDLLEQFGFRFFHPERTYKPTRATIVIPDTLDINESPSYDRRGFHIHTMHPTPHSEFLQRSDPQYLAFAKRLIDWHVRNKCNYMQWELLRTVDYDAEIEHFRAIVDYGHRRGMDMGIVVTYALVQQKAWRIVPNANKECKEEMEENIDQLMQVPWDHINIEMGTSEFTDANDVLQVKWMDNTAAYLRESYPDTEASVKVHVSSGQTAPHYNDINFNFLAQEADTDMGVYPHTVMYYDLLGPAPVYGNANFMFIYDWMIEMAKERKTYYYPETAYWVTLDINVPLFLPIYVLNRWKDINMLRDKDIDGIVTFTSGHEWGYWLNDFTNAAYKWDAAQDWTDGVEEFTGIFGDAAPTIRDALVDLTEYQEQALQYSDYSLISYISGQDTWDEIHWMVSDGIKKKPVTFKILYGMKAAELEDFEETVLARLSEMSTKYKELMDQVDAARDQVPYRALPWYEEMADSFRVNYYRVTHAYLLYAGAINRRYQELGIDPDGEQAAQELFDDARQITSDFLELMRKRETAYRYPLFLSVGWERSLTSYDYRYLWHASTAYFYKRFEKQAIDKNFNPLLMNVIDVMWFLF